MKLQISHSTRYDYGAPVSLSPHLLYLRPRESARQKLTAFELTISPNAIVTKVLDPLDNDLQQARFPELTDRVEIKTVARIETFDTNPFDFVVKDYAVKFPFTYEPVFAFALGIYLKPPFDQTQRRLRTWMRKHLPHPPQETIPLLSALNTLIFTTFTYERREERGIQSSVTTLERGRGACRDFAVLLVEICRTLGLAARFISGYLHAPDGDDHRTFGAMHAWTEVYVPGAGWKALDPTHGLWCDDRFVPVAHAAQAESVNPVQGTYYSPTPISSRLAVDVTVERLD